MARHERQLAVDRDPGRRNHAAPLARNVFSLAVSKATAMTIFGSPASGRLPATVRLPRRPSERRQFRVPARRSPR
jgi:hypothetical protein